MDQPTTAPTYDQRVQEFLAQRRIAVAGVSRTATAPANAIYQKLKGAGYEVFAVNPNAETFDGAPCYPSLAAIPGGVDGAVLVTRPEVSEELVRQCAQAGIARVWMHQSFDKASTSVSERAVAFCAANGIAVIAGGCPMMFCSPDLGHSCMRWLMRRTGALPRR